MLKNIDKKSIRNIVIFVIDSLRWDFLPNEAKKKGVVFKTIASSLYTASSFPSIVSGLYPPKHGVYNWENILSKTNKGLIGFDGYNISLWCESTWIHLLPGDSQIHSILGLSKGISLKEIKPPFIYIEDDKGGHSPYGLPFGDYMVEGNPDFFKEYGKKGRDELIKQYKKGIAQSFERFLNRMNIIEQRKLIESTLIILTSDHGELLGEYGGLTSHGRPACPELVYVPTIFIHPSLDITKINSGIIRHVDLYPTIAGILNLSVPENIDGVNLLDERNYPQTGLNFRKKGYLRSKSKFRESMSYGATSAWDFHGGHVFHSLPVVISLAFFYFRIFIKRHSEFYFMIENLKKISYLKNIRGYLTALKHLSCSYLKYMKPRIPKKDAKKAIKRYKKNIRKIENKEQVLDEEARQKLEDLGYVD